MLSAGTTQPTPTETAAEHGQSALTVALRAGAVTRALLLVGALLLVCSVAGQLLERAHPESGVYASVMRATNAGLEGNLPSLYSAALLLASALLVGLLARTATPRMGIQARGWRMLTWVFAYLTADEYLHLHELLTAPMRQLLRVDGVLHYAWVVPYAALGVVLLAVLAPFLRSLPPRVLGRMLGAAAAYVLGAVGLELLGGLLDSRLGEAAPALLAASTLEEGLEMTGAILFIGVLLDCLGAARPGTTFTLAFSGPTST
ncbi:hypothetical protein [Deinococcus yunweiensis]|uniref:hypothetical protein n=1 Tax=Deinococcus yunweiensis TaxID=367282 RepID=UPI00398EF35F